MRFFPQFSRENNTTSTRQPSISHEQTSSSNMTPIPSPQSSLEAKYAASVLPKRRSAYAKDLNSKLHVILYAFVIAQFLKESSMSKVLFRLLVELACSRLSDADFLVIVSFDVGQLRKFLVMLMSGCHIFCVTLSILSEPPKGTIDGVFTGFWSVQLIGEMAVESRWELVWYDMVIFVAQVLILASRVGGDVEEERQLLTREYDGLQGNVVVASLSMKEVFS